MKKLLILALGVLLLVAFTAPAMAETKVEFKGHYRVRYFHLHNFQMQKNGWNNAYQEDHRAYFDQRFRIEPKFIVSDCLELRMRIQGAAYNRWGHANNPGDFRAWDDASPAGTREFEIVRMYMVIKTKFGQFFVGRMRVGVAGLDSLGYSGTRFSKASGYALVGPFDFENHAHRIQWFNKWGGFGLAAGYQKDMERDDTNAGAQGVPTVNAGYDDDQDQFFILPSYEWKNGSVNMLFLYIRGRAWNEQGGPGFTGAAGARYGNWGWGNAAMAYPLDWDLFALNPAFQMKFGPFSMHAEAMYGWGELRPDRDFAHGYNDENLFPNVKGSGWGIYMDGVYNYGPGEAGAMFSYIQGRNFDDYNEVDGAMTGMLGLGNANGHIPFLVAYDRGLFNNMALMNTGPFNATFGNWNNHWMLGFWNDYNITEDFMLHAALGYFQLVNAPERDAINAVNVRNGGAATATDDVSKDLGWEFDIGGYYKIMDGLSFTSGFGYFWGGKAWKYGNDNVEVGNSYVWKNQLILSF
jgi:hypothetical protein